MLLAGGDITVTKDIIENLDFIGVGVVPQTRGTSAGEHFEQAVKIGVKDTIWLTDSPPLALVSDGMLVDQADGVVLVVRDRQTRR